MVVDDDGFKQISHIILILHINIMRQRDLLHQILVIAHRGKMQPVFGDAVFRNVVIGLHGVAGQQK